MAAGFVIAIYAVFPVVMLARYALWAFGEMLQLTPRQEDDNTSRSTGPDDA